MGSSVPATQQEAREAPEAMTTIVDVDAYLRPFAPAIAVFNGLGEASCIARVAPVEQWVMNTAESTGIPHDQLRNVLCLFLVFPIGLIFQSIKSPTVKHLFSLVTGMAFAQFAFGSDWMHTVLTSVVVYLVLVLGSISKAIAKQQHIIIFTFLLTYLSATHIYRTLTDYMGWSLDITGPLMLMTIKLSALGFNVFDGTVDRAVLVKQADAEAQKQKAGQRFQRTPADRLQRSVSTVPSPLEYFGYVFCFCSYVAGPAFEITEYLNSIDGSKYKSTDGVAPGGRIGHALKKLAWGILFIALLKAVGDVYFPMTGTYSKAIAEDSPFWYRIVYAWVALFFVRCKYYFGWLVAEGGAVMSGFGYDPKKKDWSGASNMDVWAFEWAPNIDMGARAWNKFTQSWLERYVFKRTPRVFELNRYITYFISAFWHGFYPGYYLFFLSVPFGQAVCKALQAKVRTRLVDAQTGKAVKGKELIRNVYDIVGRIMTTLTMNYLASSFVVLGLAEGLTLWGSIYWCGHIGFAVMLVLLSFVSRPKRKSG